MSADSRTAGSLQRVGMRRLRVARPEEVPEEIAVCPECGGRLWWQVTTTDGLRDMVLDCETEDEDDEDSEHRGWQSEWQPVIDKVKRWVVGAAASHTAKLTP